ncbi:TorF family putative porin [Herbaspirillum seropedicae]|uniref:TorF family putative porin n=1 Tax=Herbaspirillum seropedicae TaxID=964 RepID=UPI000848323A|nr:TorF family putative porin [Herbaspirillum seropedicae]AON56855.1 hypothetical protein Hsc_4600 [Herbaspirillum seropedicae]
MTTYTASLSRLGAFSAFSATLAALLACAPALAEDAPAAAPAGPWTITKHIDLASRYVLRGVTTTYGNGQPLGNSGADAPESDQPALQWGIDFVHSSGWSFGYWASTINYSYKQLGNSYSDRSITEFQKPRSVENDLYFAYAGNISGDLGYTLGMTGYYYLNGSHANALETKAGLTLGALSLNAQTLLNDVVWGNKGDTYWTLAYTKPLPYDITFTGTLGAYTYKREGKYLGTRDTATGTACGSGQAFAVNGCFAGNGPSSGGLRHLTLGLSAPFPNSPITWSLQAILGGYNRFDVKQGNQLVGMLSWGF